MYSDHHQIRHGGEYATPDSCAEEETILLIAASLHDLCQPLTALQCRLEIGLMDGSKAGITCAVRDALTECVRMNGYVRAMQMSVVDRQRATRGHL